MAVKCVYGAKLNPVISSASIKVLMIHIRKSVMKRKLKLYFSIYLHLTVVFDLL